MHRGVFHFFLTPCATLPAAPVASEALTPHKLMRYSSLGLTAIIPAALLLEPSSLVYPLDLALGVLLPVHMHLGMRDVVRDYVPRPQAGMAQIGLWVVSVVTALGLTKLNFNGDVGPFPFYICLSGHG